MKKLILTVMIGCFMGSALASVITPQQAIRRASSESLKISSNHSTNPTLIYTEKDNAVPTIYLFQTEAGMLALSADTDVVPLLGYSDTACSPENFPPAFKGWLESISREISYVRESGIVATRATESDDYAPIAPLCATKWNQDAPFYNDCPEESDSGKRCYTGCAATSMAQVMKYHNWPDVGVGEITYRWSSGKQDLSIDFSSQRFDWNNMLDVYTAGEYTDSEGAAVAGLMKSCGYSIQMNYSSSGSGALSPFMGNALGEYFKYDKSKLRYIRRSYYPFDEWKDIIYNSLSEDGPVILNGQSNQGGHSFVCDGYDKDGYFHINWGWGGMSDGYYLLTALNPLDQGAGGSGDNSGFNAMQDAVLGIVPDRADSSTDNSWIGQIYAQGYIGFSKRKTYSLGGEVENLCPDGIYNYGPGYLPEDMLLALIFTSENTGESYATAATIGERVDLLYGIADFALPIPEEMPDGDYKVKLSYYSPSYAESKSANKTVMKEENSESEEEWIDVLFPNGIPDYYIARVAGGSVKFYDPSSIPSGVDEISIENSERYFNLQGIEIEKPLPGEISIVVKGSAIKKVVK